MAKKIEEIRQGGEVALADQTHWLTSDGNGPALRELWRWDFDLSKARHGGWRSRLEARAQHGREGKRTRRSLSS